MLNLILAIVVAAIAAFLVVAYMQPDDFHVERTATINAPAAAVFEQVNDLHKWQAWSPWAKLDPKATNTFTDQAAGKGASMGWDGNMKVGKGTMIITGSRPNEEIDFDLVFEKPMRGNSTSRFTFKPSGQTTEVSWSMDGKSSFPAKMMGLLFNCNKMVGEQFELGLSSLNDIASKK